MKKPFLTIILLTTLLACNNSKNNDNKSINENTTTINNDKNSDGTYKYICTKNIFSDFIVMNSSLEKKSKPYLVTYAFKGIIKNNTKNIYEKAFLRGELLILLKNGQELTCDDINYSKEFIGSGVFPIVKNNWKPNEEWVIPNSESCHFSVEYFNYPVKKVFTQYYLELTDQINSSKTELMISQNEVTDKWKIAEKKYLTKKYDCTDTSIIKFIENK